MPSRSPAPPPLPAMAEQESSMNKIHQMSTRIIKSSALALLASGTALASSHREAPLITEDPTVDSTDVFAFRSPDAPNTVTLIANYIPLEEPFGAPNGYFFSDS